MAVCRADLQRAGPRVCVQVLDRRGSQHLGKAGIKTGQPHFSILNSSRVWKAAASSPLHFDLFCFYLFLFVSDSLFWQTGHTAFNEKVPFNLIVADPSRALATFDAMKLLPHYSQMSWQNAYDVNFNEDWQF